MPRKVKVSARALVARINRKLAPLQIVRTRPGTWARKNLGAFYSLRASVVVDVDLDLEAFAREHGFLMPFEIIGE